MLENDQLTIQGMMGSRYLMTFEEEVTRWQKELAAVADVMIVLADNQRVWSYLEPLFMKSKEVQEELPEDAKRFKGTFKIEKLKCSCHYNGCNYRKNYFYWFILLFMCSL